MNRSIKKTGWSDRTLKDGKDITWWDSFKFYWNEYIHGVLISLLICLCIFQCMIYNRTIDNHVRRELRSEIYVDRLIAAYEQVTGHELSDDEVYELSRKYFARSGNGHIDLERFRLEIDIKRQRYLGD